MVSHSDLDAFLAAYDPETAAGLVVDIAVVGHDGMDRLGELAAKSEMPPTLALGDSSDVDLVVRVIRLGAIDCLPRPCGRDRAIERLVDLCRVSQESMRQRSRLRKLRQAATGLTNREREVLDASIEGMSPKAVALALGISIRTAHIHRTNAMRKLGVNSIVELADVGRCLQGVLLRA